MIDQVAVASLGLPLATIPRSIVCAAVKAAVLVVSLHVVLGLLIVQVTVVSLPLRRTVNVHCLPAPGAAEMLTVSFAAVPAGTGTLTLPSVALVATNVPNAP